MRRAARPLLAIALLLVLAALLVREIVAEASLRFDPKPGAAMTPTEARRADDPPPDATGGFELPPLQRFTVITRRPLFESGRRTPEPRAEPEPTAPAPAPLDAVLKGIVWSGGERIALIAPSGSERAHRLAQGDSYGDWTLERIDAGTVELMRDGETVELSLGFRSLH